MPVSKHLKRLVAYARVIEIVLGLLFVVPAVLKALELPHFVEQILHYHVVFGYYTLRAAAIGSILVETILGILLITGARMRGMTLLATLAVLSGFTALIVYAWVRHNLADCACWGSFLPAGPALSIGKNVIMMTMAGVVWLAHVREAVSLVPKRGRWVRVATALLAVAAVGLAVAFGDNARFFKPPETKRPFARFQFEFDGQSVDLGSGRHLVAVLSATCLHCKTVVLETLNPIALTSGDTRVAGLVFAQTPDEYGQFLQETETQFPSLQIDFVTFSELIGTEPPRFYCVEDGIGLAFLDSLEPTPEELLKLVHRQTVLYSEERDPSTAENGATP